VAKAIEHAVAEGKNKKRTGRRPVAGVHAICAGLSMHGPHFARAFHALLFAVQHVYRRGPFHAGTPVPQKMKSFDGP